MHPPLLLAHRNHPCPRPLGRSEMNMAHLGERIADSIVDRAFADLAALDMRHRNTQRQRHRSRRQHLIPVGDQQQNIRTHRPQQIGKTQRRNADGLRHPYIGIRTKQALDPAIDSKAVFLDLLGSSAQTPETSARQTQSASDRYQDARPAPAAASKDGCSPLATKSPPQSSCSLRNHPIK